MKGANAFGNIKLENISLSYLKLIINRELHKTLQEFTQFKRSKNPKDDDEYITMDELAALLRVKRSTIKKYNVERRISFVKAGRNPLYKKADVLAYINGCKVKSMDEIKKLANT